MIQFFIFAGGWGLGAALGIVVGGIMATKNIATGWRISQHLDPLPAPPAPTPTPSVVEPETPAVSNPLPFLVNKDRTL